jgi:hypothetical protein
MMLAATLAATLATTTMLYRLGSLYSEGRLGWWAQRFLRNLERGTYECLIALKFTHEPSLWEKLLKPPHQSDNLVGFHVSFPLPVRFRWRRVSLLE